MLENSLTTLNNRTGKTHFCLLSENELQKGLRRSFTTLDPIWKSSTESRPTCMVRNLTDLVDSKLLTCRKNRFKLDPVTVSDAEVPTRAETETASFWEPVLEEVSNSNRTVIILRSKPYSNHNSEEYTLNESRTLHETEICRCHKKVSFKLTKALDIEAAKERKSQLSKSVPKPSKWRKDYASNFLSNSFEFDQSVKKLDGSVNRFEPSVNKCNEKQKNDEMSREQGQRFKSVDGRDAAATLIQSIWRMYVKRRDYLHYRKQKWAAGMIAISWIMNAKLSKIRKQLINTNRSLIDSYRLRMKASYLLHASATIVMMKFLMGFLNANMF